MKRIVSIFAALLILTAALTTGALADSDVFYPASVTRSPDGTEIRKVYELSPRDDPAGIPRSDFEQAGFHYTMIELLKQEQPEYEEREYTETVELESESRDMESVLALLPQEREFITDDGFTGTLALRLDTVRVEEAGRASGSSQVSATRSYPNLQGQDTQYIPKTLEDNGKTLTLQSIDWVTDNTATMDGYALGDRFTAVATYTGTAYYSYVTGYTVTADYSGTVSRIALDKVRYVAVFEGVNLNPEPTPDPVIDLPLITIGPGAAAGEAAPAFNWVYVWIVLGVLVLAGGGIGVALVLKRRRESEDTEE